MVFSSATFSDAAINEIVRYKRFRSSTIPPLPPHRTQTLTRLLAGIGTRWFRCTPQEQLNDNVKPWFTAVPKGGYSRLSEIKETDKEATLSKLTALKNVAACKLPSDLKEGQDHGKLLALWALAKHHDVFGSGKDGLPKLVLVFCPNKPSVERCVRVINAALTSPGVVGFNGKPFPKDHAIALTGGKGSVDALTGYQSVLQSATAKGWPG